MPEKAASLEPPSLRIAGRGAWAALGGPEDGAFFEALAAGRTVPAAGGKIEDFDPSRWSDSRQIRRMTRLGGLTLVAAGHALADAGLSLDPAAPGDDVALVFSTMHGATQYLVEFHEGFLEHGPVGASPILFTNGVTNAAAGHLSLEYGIRGPCLTFTGGACCPFEALESAFALTRAGATTVVAAAAEEWCDLLAAAYRSLDRSGRRFGLALPGPRPICEGAAVLVLDGEAGGGPRLFPPAFAPPAADRADAARPVAQAAGAALRRAGRDPEDVDLVVCALDGSAADAGEREALGEVFAGRARPLPVAAPCAALGEGFAFTRWAQVFVAAEALARGRTLPAPAGLSGLPAPLHAAGGPLAARTALVVARDSDGGAAAAVLSR